MVLRSVKRTLFALFCLGLGAIAYVGHDYIANRKTVPDAIHTVPFDAHGDTVYVSASEDRDYDLLWLATILIGTLGGAVYMIDQRAQKRQDGSR